MIKDFDLMYGMVFKEKNQYFCLFFYKPLALDSLIIVIADNKSMDFVTDVMNNIFIIFIIYILMRIKQNYIEIQIENKTNWTNLYPPTKGYLRETCKSQNINPIYLALSSPSVLFRSQQTSHQVYFSA